MPDDKAQQLIEAVNSQLNAEEFLRAIDYRTESIQTLGGVIKAPCCVHKDKQFVTLLVFPNKNTAKCMVSSCPAFKEITLVEAYGHFVGKTGADAAVAAAELANVSIPAELREGVLVENLESAQEAFQAGDNDESLRLIAKVREKDSRNPLVPLLAGQVYEKQDNKTQACEEFVLAARLAIRQDDPERAESIINDNLLRLEPGNVDYMLELADAQQSLGKTELFLQTTIKACKKREENERAGDSLALLDRLQKYMADNAGLRLCFANSLRSAQETDKACQQYLLVAEQLAESDIQRCLQAVRSAVELSPENLEARELYVNYLHTSGNNAQAGENLLFIGEELSKQAGEDKAADAFERAALFAPENPQAIIRFAQTIPDDRHPEERLNIQLKAAKLCLKQKKHDTAAELLKKAVEADPSDLAAASTLFDALVAIQRDDDAIEAIETWAKQIDENGSIAEVTEQLRQLIEDSEKPGAPHVALSFILSHQDKTGEAISLLENLVKFDDSAVIRNQLIRCLVKAGQAEKAFVEKLILVGVFQDNQRDDAADLLLKEVSDNDSEDLSAEIDAERALRKGDVQFAAEQFQEIANARKRKGDQRGCVRALRRLAAASSSPSEIYTTLIDYYFESKDVEGGLNAIIDAIDVAVKSNAENQITSLANRFTKQATDQWTIAQRMLEKLLPEHTDEAIGILHSMLGNHAGKGDNEALLQLCDRALEAFPEDKRILETLVAVYEGLKRHEDAIRIGLTLGKVISANSESKDALPLYKHLFDLDNQSKDAATALADYYKELGNQEKAAATLLALAEKLKEENREKELGPILQQAVEMCPTSVEAGTMLAEFLRGLGDSSSACQEYRRIAKVQAGSDDPMRAHEFFKKAIELQPNEVEAGIEYLDFLEEAGIKEAAWNLSKQVAEICFEKDDEKKGIEILRRAGRTQALEVSRRTEIVSILYQRGHDDEALAEATAAADRQLERPNIPAAMQILAAATEMAPDNIELLQAMVRVQLTDERIEDAARTLSTIARKQSNLSDFDASESTWREVLDLDSSNPDAHEGLVEIFEQQGEERFDETVELLESLIAILQDRKEERRLASAYQKLLKYDDNQSTVREELARILADQEEHQTARDEFVRLAEDSINEGRKEDALKYFGDAIKQDGGNIGILRRAMDVAIELNQAEPAVEYGIAVVDQFVKNDLFEDASSIAIQLTDLAPERVELWKKAAEAATKSGKKDMAASHYLAGANAVLEEDKEAAKEFLEKLSELGLRDSMAHHEAAEVMTKLGDQSAASSHLLDAARIELASGDSETALKTAESISPTEEGEEELHLFRAELYKSLKRPDDAADQIEKVLEKKEDAQERKSLLQQVIAYDPTRSERRAELAAILQNAGATEDAAGEFAFLAEEVLEPDPQKALEFLDKAYLLTPESTTIRQLFIEAHTAAGNTKEAEGHLTWLAEYYRDNEEDEKAIDIYVSALEKNPDRVDLRVGLAEVLTSQDRSAEAAHQYIHVAEVYFGNGDRERGLASLQLAVSINPEDSAPKIKLARSYMEAGHVEDSIDEYMKLATTSLEQGLIDEARNLVEELLDGQANNITLRVRVARLYEQNQIPELAAHEFEQIARLHFENERLKEVEQWCRKALELRPRSLEPRKLLGEVFKKENRNAEALEQLLPLVDQHIELGNIGQAQEIADALGEIDGDSIEVNERIAAVYQNLDDKQRLMGALRKLVEGYRRAANPGGEARALERLMSIRPDDTNIRQRYLPQKGDIPNQGTAHLHTPEFLVQAAISHKKGQTTEAIELAEKAIEKDDNNLEAYRFLSEVHIENEDREAAIEVLGRLADACTRLNEPRVAADALKKVARQARQSPLFYFVQGKVHESQNARGMALQDYQKAALLYQERSDKEGQRRVIERALKLDPYNPQLLSAQVDLLIDEGKSDEAKRAQYDLAELFASRSMDDLSAEVYRQIVDRDDDELEAWQSLIATSEKFQDKRELIPDYISYGKLLHGKGKIREALDSFSKAIYANPRNIEAREKYIDAYKKMGTEADLIQDYITLGDLYANSGRLDTAVGLFMRVRYLDPDNQQVEKRLSETSSGLKGRPLSKHATSEIPTHRPHETRSHSRISVPKLDSMNEASTPPISSSMPKERPQSSADFLNDELAFLDEEDENETLQQVVSNYEEILSVNPQNANVRVKLATLYEQQGDIDKTIEQLVHATEALFQKSDWGKCIEVCERVLKLRPSEHKVRNRLKQAFNKRDAFKALESAIIFTDNLEETETSDRRKTDR